LLLSGLIKNYKLQDITEGQRIVAETDNCAIYYKRLDIVISQRREGRYYNKCILAVYTIHFKGIALK
jgi:hypothetical protein